jgi:hypothetical protein
VDARLRIRRERGQGGEDDPGSAEHDRERTGAIDPDAERAGGLVAGTGGDGNSVGRLARHRR